MVLIKCIKGPFLCVKYKIVFVIVNPKLKKRLSKAQAHGISLFTIEENCKVFFKSKKLSKFE